MSERKPLPDKINKGGNILDQLQRIETKSLEQMSEAEIIAVEKEENSPSASQTEKAAPAQSQTTAASEPVITVPQIISKATTKPTGIAATKTKVNLYLEAEIKRRTEQAQIDLRRIAPQQSAGQINYSLIVETALQIVFDELDRIGEASQLSKEVMNKLKTR